jgi:zinc/manganese transport system permease protein
VRAISLGFTVAGAAVFALTRRARRHVSQEAIVGIVYALSSALMVIALSHSPHGGEEIKDILAGSLLVTTWEQVRFAALAYAVLGAIQLALARRFVTISWQLEHAEHSVRWLALWDFAFYVLFGIAITISVQVAGVLLVFSYLIVPAVITRLFGRAVWSRLVLGWVVALLASVLGLWGSWAWDLPTGVAIVAAFGVLLVLAGAVATFTLRGRAA